MTHRNLIPGLSALAATTLLLLGISWLFQSQIPGATFWVLIWAGAEGLLAFSGLRWSLGRSNTAFFSMFAGGSLLRLVSIGVAAWILTVAHVAPTVPLLSLVLAYFLLSLVQIPFLTHGLR